MSKPRITVFDGIDGYRCAWLIEDDEGARVGDRWGVSGRVSSPFKLPGPGDDLREVLIAENVAIRLYAAAGGSGGREEVRYGNRDDCFVWDSRTLCQRACAQMNREIADDRKGRVWPEWASLAKAAGWTPPKGWTP